MAIPDELVQRLQIDICDTLAFEGLDANDPRGHRRLADHTAWRVYADTLLDRGDRRGAVLLQSLGEEGDPSDHEHPRFVAQSSGQATGLRPLALHGMVVALQVRTWVALQGLFDAWSAVRGRVAGELCCALAIEQVRLGSDEFVFLAERTPPPGLRSLSIRDPDRPGLTLEPDTIARFVDSAWLDDLLALQLDQLRVDDAVSEIVARSPDLRTLVLPGCGIGEDGIDDLVTSKAWRSLDTLRLDHNPLEDTGALALVQAPPMHLRTLSLADTALGEVGLRAVLGAPGFDELRWLDLSNNGIGTPGAIAIAKATAVERLETLSLRNNPLSNEGIAAIATSPRLGAVRSLSLSRTGLGPDGVRALAESGPLGELNYLDLSDNPLGEDGGLALANGQIWGALTHLSLARCGIGPEAAYAIAESPAMRNLVWLDVTGNDIHIFAAQTLAEQLTRLGWLILRGNPLGADGPRLARRLPVMRL